MELKKYYINFLKSYLISFFFFKKSNDIVFIKFIKIFINAYYNKKWIFIFFIVIFLIFNKKILFYKKKKIIYLDLYYFNFKLFYFLQFFLIIFLPLYMRQNSVKFNFKNIFYKLNIKKLIFLYFNNFFFNINFLRFIDIFFFFNYENYILIFFFLRLLNIPIEKLKKI